MSRGTYLFAGFAVLCATIIVITIVMIPDLLPQKKMDVTTNQISAGVTGPENLPPRRLPSESGKQRAFPIVGNKTLDVEKNGLPRTVPLMVLCSYKPCGMTIIETPGGLVFPQVRADLLEIEPGMKFRFVLIPGIGPPVYKVERVNDSDIEFETGMFRKGTAAREEADKILSEQSVHNP